MHFAIENENTWNNYRDAKIEGGVEKSVKELMFDRSSKNQFGRPNKRSAKVSKNLEVRS